MTHAEAEALFDRAYKEGRALHKQGRPMPAPVPASKDSRPWDVEDTVQACRRIGWADAASGRASYWGLEGER